MSESISKFYERPGAGLPLDHYEEKACFPNYVKPDADTSRGKVYAVAVRELRMLHFMNAITDKTDWQTKVFDEEIISHWRDESRVGEVQSSKSEEAKNNTSSSIEQENSEKESKDKDQDEKDKGGEGETLQQPEFTAAMFDWCIAELQDLAKNPLPNGCYRVFDYGIIKSDSAIEDGLRKQLIDAVAPFEDVPDRHKDWHPRSDDQVLDLVHPSLFPLVYGRSRILVDKFVPLKDSISLIGAGQITKVPENDSEWYSSKFQWLPCEVDISLGEARIVSYINNIHPSNTTMYDVLGKIMQQVIPVWSLSLSEVNKLRSFKRLNLPRVRYNKVNYVERDADPHPLPGEEDEAYYKRLEQWENKPKTVVLPEPGRYDPEFRTRDVPELSKEDKKRQRDAGPVDLWKDFQISGLQVIIKLANIHLTPEKPSYPGGSWHVEGQLNERICASAIYYYDSENITGDSLSFRQPCHTDQIMEIHYPQWEDHFLTQVYGLQNEEEATQTLGAVNTPQGRLLVFPNVFQHHVDSFELADKSKPGHRKILALFLVDPHAKIISTANVPPQQREWWAQQVMGGAHTSDLIGRLPAETRNEITELVDDFPIALEDAKELRLELMAERSKFVDVHNDASKQYTFFLCEH